MSIGSAIGSSIGRAIGSALVGGGGSVLTQNLLAHWKIADSSTLYQTTDTSTPVTATGQQIGRASDQIGTAHATQSTASNRPTIPSAGYRLRSDFTNVILAATLPSSGALPTVVNTPYGHYVTEAHGAASLRLPLNDATDVRVYSSLTDAQLTALASAYGTSRKYMVALSSDTTIANLRIRKSDAGTTDLLFIGANGATVTKTLSLDSDTSYDVSADGLTAPVAVAWPESLITSGTLQRIHCNSNQLTGSIPSLSANTALTIFYCYNNQLTGSIPSLSANTSLTSFYCYSNQLTGSIPSLSANTALTIFYCNNNQLTGFSGGSVSDTLGDFQALNNLLTQAAVDAILAAFVAANKTTGIRILNLGGTGNATPSATGLTDKATLVSRGWTVTTN